MNQMITNIDDYFARGCGRCERFETADCSTKQWQKGLDALRRLCLDTGMTEHVKWGHPCYMHADRNIVIIGAFREDFRLSFFNAALMKDPLGVLEKQGPNTRHPDMFQFTQNDQVQERSDAIQQYLAEAMSYAEAGIKPPKEEVDIELPEELLEALEADPELHEAFFSLTPGRQRSYAFNLNAAKKSETRINRIIKFRDKILSGKGANEY